MAARLGGDAKRTRFVVDLTKSVDYAAKVLADPYRVIIDLPEVEFEFPPGLGRLGRGLVREYRYGQFGEGKSRIVLDVTGPVLVAKSFVISPRTNQPARLVLDLVKTDAGRFAEAARQREAKEQRETTRADEIAAVLQKMIAAAPALPAPRPSAKPDKAASLPQGVIKPKKPTGKPVIIIDPGHGGVDPGAIGRKGTAEKSVTLAFARTLRDKLKASGRYRVYMTRNSDRFVRLRDRVKFARLKGGHLFISVHADSIKRGRASGATVYTLSDKASDREAAALAAKENRADIIAGVTLKKESSEVTGILIDLAQRETKHHSIQFAKQLVERIKGVSRIRRKSMRQAGFRVLKAPDVPSVLVELGFLSSRRDEANLRSRKWRAKMAGAVKKAVDRYFKRQLARQF
ncbi:MAG: N-acetylmuramoyl-L-alanine amidase [Pseudomonadota bacterium]